MQAALRKDSVPGAALNLERLFLQHHQTVYWAAFRITGNEMDSEDALQTVFARLATRNPLPDLSSGARSYLQRAAINAALDIVRSRTKERKVSLEEVERVLPEPDGQSPDQLHSASELRAWLRQAIAELSPRAAEVFVLRYLEGYGNVEIARMLGTSQSTIAVTLHRCRVRLSESMRGFFGESL